MRSSSIKSVISALSIVTTLTFAVAPPAEARAAQSRETRSEPRDVDAIVRAVRLLVKRITGGITTYGLPTVPIPGPSGTTTTSGSGTTTGSGQ